MKDLLGVLLVALVEFFVRPRDASGRLAQAVAARIVAGPTQKRPHGLLGLGAARTHERRFWRLDKLGFHDSRGMLHSGPS